MPDLLLELFSEEIPARMQAQAAADLKKLVTDALVERGLTYEGAQAFATPRRLALHVAGLPARQPDTREERKGPRVGAPEAAVAGFLKAAGLAALDQAKIEKDPKGKGEFYVAVIERVGRATLDVLAEVLPAIVRGFPWPKSMRWGAASAKSDSLRWVRPLHSIVATFGPETEEPEIVPFEVDGVKTGNVTRGHRFMSPGEIRVRRLDDYEASLQQAKVVLDPARRRDIIAHDARDLAFAQGLELVEDEGLLAEVAGLVEWPVTLMGEFDEAFLQIPPEVIRATIRANQKCFVLRRADGALANKFILVSNIVASDGGKAIAAGNGRVVRARLSDALYFWQTDQKPLPDYADKGTLLDQRMAKLRALNIVFHEKLGTQGERVERIKALAKELAPLVGADPALAERAAELCKADLMTEVVGEFPETQGLMGRRYAELQGEPAEVCVALEDHYKPQGPSDRVPTNKVAIAVALADKLDTLVGFWAIDEKPTGSKDPYALRRAALGVIRIIRANELRVSLASIIAHLTAELAVQAHMRWVGTKANQSDFLRKIGVSETTISQLKSEIEQNLSIDHGQQLAKETVQKSFQTCLDLMSFFADRLKVQLRQEGAAFENVDAVFSLIREQEDPKQSDLLLITRRVEALGKFLDTDDGKNLLAGYRRAVNILKAEEKKEKDGGAAFQQKHAPDLRVEPEEHKLALEIERAAKNAGRHVAEEDFEAAMRSLAQLRAPVDAFFVAVTVNDPDPARRLNRLRILNELREATLVVADFSKIAG